LSNLRKHSYESNYIENEDGVKVHYRDADENLLGANGSQIAYQQAINFFPYLKEESFWIDERGTVIMELNIKSLNINLNEFF
jgi:hypothetical protein